MVAARRLPVQHVLFGTFPTKLWRAHVAATLGATELFDDRAGRLGQQRLGGRRVAYIAGDPHRILELPGVYQQVRLACPEFDVVGLAFPGVPGVPHFGHAGDGGLGGHQRDGRLPGPLPRGAAPRRRRGSRSAIRARLGAGRRRTSRPSSVRGADPVPVEVIETPRGPIDRPTGISLRIPTRVESRLGFGALLPLLRAKTVDDVAAALRAWVEPVNSVLVADATGAVLQPGRRAGAGARRPLPPGAGAGLGPAVRVAAATRALPRTGRRTAW